MKTEELNLIGGEILDAAITVHKELGPGLLESAYHPALQRELQLRGLNVKGKIPVEMIYKDVLLGKAYEIDYWLKMKLLLRLCLVMRCILFTQPGLLLI